MPKLLFFLLGNVSLLPLNIIFNAINIFIDITNKATIADDLNRAYNIPASITALILCFVNPRNYRLYMCGAIGTAGIILCIFPIFMFSSINGDTMYWLCLVCIGITGVLGSLMFSCSFSFASKFPKAPELVSSGNGCCGFIASVLSIIVSACLTNSTAIAFYSLYFFVAAIILFATLGYVLYKGRDQDIRVHMIGNQNEITPSVFSRQTVEVIKVIWTQWLSIFFCYMIFLSLFPGYVTRTIEGLLGSWKNILVPTLFCIFDWAGRAFAGVKMWPGPRYAWIPVVVRFLFYPIFMLSIQKVLPLGDPWTLAWMVPFATSSGYYSTVQMVYASSLEGLHTPEMKMYAGFLMPFGVNCGIIMTMVTNIIINTSLHLK